MTVSINNALAAYRDALARVGTTGAEARKREEPSFAGMVKDAIETSVSTMAKGEEAAKGSVTGKAGLTEVITAVTNAELTLQTVVAVRDRVMQAYQEIMRMPI